MITIPGTDQMIVLGSLASILKSPIRTNGSGIGGGSPSSCHKDSAFGLLHAPPSAGARRMVSRMAMICAARSCCECAPKWALYIRKAPSWRNLMTPSKKPDDHVMAISQGRFRQRKKPRRQDRCLRQDHIAELPANVFDAAVGLGRARIDIEVRAIDPIVSIENLSELRRLVDVTTTLPIAFDFLQGDDIGAVDFAGDPLQIETTVFAESELDVVGDDFH